MSQPNSEEKGLQKAPSFSVEDFKQTFLLKNEEVGTSRWLNDAMRMLFHVDGAAEKFLEVFGEKDYGDLAKFIRTRSGGVHFDAIMLCKGKSCPMAKKCPFNISKEKIAFMQEHLYGKPCPLETHQVLASIIQYADEFGIKDGDFVDNQLVIRLAVTDMIERRIFNIISTNMKLLGFVEEVITDYDEDGKAMVGKQVISEWQVLQDLDKSRLSTLKALVGTRETKYRRDVAMKKSDKTGDMSSDQARDHARYKQEMKDTRADYDPKDYIDVNED